VTPLTFLLRVGRSDDERLSLQGDLGEERRARLARGGARIADAAREATAAGLPFTTADVVGDLRLRVVEMSMVFEIPSLTPLVRMWVVSHESEPVGLPSRMLVTSPGGRVSTRFDAAAFSHFPLVPLDLVVKSGSQVRRCTIPVAGVRNVIGR